MARSALILTFLTFITLMGATAMLGAWQSPLWARESTERSPRGSSRAVDPALVSRVEAIVDRLASPSWAEREAAFQELLALPMPEAQGPIEARLRRGELDPEQRHRLVDAASRRLVEQPRGALGISMDTMRGGFAGVRVAALVPGMPAASVLRIGDVIETINDQPILSSAILSDIVQRLAPESTVRMRILRPVLDEKGRARRDRGGQVVSQPLEVSMRLGSMEQLNSADRLGRTGTRAGSDVQLSREMAARQLRREHASKASLVRVAGADAPVSMATFTAYLNELERTLVGLENSDIRSRPEATTALLETARRINELSRRQSEPDVSDRDRQRLATVYRRLALLLSDDRAPTPIDRLEPAPAP